MQYEWTVSARDTGKTLLQFLQERFTDCSMRKVKGWIDAGFCHVGGKKERFSRTQLKPGQKLELTLVETEAKKLEVLYHDEALVVVNKPSGITCDDRLERDLAKQGINAVLVHRLDKFTSGVLLLAKAQEIKAYFVEQFKALAVQKRYIAVVDGQLQREGGTIQNYLGPIKRLVGQVVWGVVHENGHYAETEWRLKQRLKQASVLELMPKTGKTHQLRVHTSFMGHPILGDDVYGKKFSCRYRAPRVLLHAEELAFIHPITKKLMHFTAKLPDDIVACIQELS